MKQKMNNDILIRSVGTVENREDRICIVIDPQYASGLKGLEEYSHVQVLWWADECDNETDRSMLIEKRPYISGTEEIGVFALRSPERPNPVCVSNVSIAYVDAEQGIIGLHWIDAFEGTRVIDLKPYTPSIDRVEHAVMPAWCSHWPRSFEESGNFDWSVEFNF